MTISNIAFSGTLLFYNTEMLCVRLSL